MKGNTRSGLWDYGFAVLAVALVVLLKQFVDPLGESAPFLLFLFAILSSA